MDPASEEGVGDVPFLIGMMHAPERWRELLAGDLEALAEEAAAAPGQIGVAVLDDAGAVVAANPAGGTALAERLGLLASRRESRLSGANLDAIVQARADLRAGRSQTIVRLTTAADDAPCFAYAMASGDLPERLAAGVTPWRQGTGRLALILPPLEASELLSASLRASFGLTPAEARLTGALRDGQTLKDAADDLGISINTARNQLRAVFDKLGVRRQVELVRALGQLTALANLLPPSLQSTGRPHGGASDVESAPAVGLFGLRSGRRLAWRDYGAATGDPVLVVHQGLGSSLFPQGTDSLARALGLRLIVPERPGCGRSDPHPHYSYDAVAADLVELVDALGVGAMQVASVLDGAPYAIAAAQRLEARVTRTILVGPRPPGWRTAASNDRAHPLLQWRRRLTAHPWSAEIVYSLMRKRLTPSFIERMVVTGAETKCDAAYLQAHPSLMAYSIAYALECFAHSARGMIDDAKAAAHGPRPDPRRLSASLTVWLGDSDPMLTADELAAWLDGKAYELRIWPQAGNFLAYEAWPHMLAWLGEDGGGVSTAQA